jgi:hypothetical protein
MAPEPIGSPLVRFARRWRLSFSLAAVTSPLPISRILLALIGLPAIVVMISAARFSA